MDTNTGSGRSHTYTKVSSASGGECYDIDLLQEVALRVCRVNTPPVVDEYVESAESHDQERCRPLRLETNSDHNASRKTDNRDEQPSNAPLSTEDEADKQEDEQDASGEQEAKIHTSLVRAWNQPRCKTHYFLRSFSERLGRPAKSFLRVYIESLKTIRRPPMTLRLRRKKLRSKMRP